MKRGKNSKVCGRAGVGGARKQQSGESVWFKDVHTAHGC